MRRALFLFFIIVCVAVPASAQELSNTQLLQEIRELKNMVKQQAFQIKELQQCYEQCGSKIAEHDQKLGDLVPTLDRDLSVRLRNQLERLESAAGVDVGVGATFVFQGTPNANNAGADGSGSTEDSRLDASYSTDIEMAKVFDSYGMAFLHLEAGQGDTLEGDLALFSNVNRDAADTNAHVDVVELWYEHYFFEKQGILTAGKIEGAAYFDTNEYANDETTQFLGHMFRNSPAIDFPDDNALGMRVCLAPEILPFIDMDVILIDENADYTEILNKPFFATQLAFTPAKAFGWDEDKWGGSYRVYYWYNGADHTEFLNPAHTKEWNTGLGLSFDQMLGEVFGWFGRFGWQDPKVSMIEMAWSTGLRMTGKYWNRDEDVLAVAFGQAIPSCNYKNAGNPGAYETHMEAYYSFKVNDHLTLSPDIQLIWDPNGMSSSADGDNDTIFVYGLRGQVNL